MFKKIIVLLANDLGLKIVGMSESSHVSFFIYLALKDDYLKIWELDDMAGKKGSLLRVMINRYLDHVIKNYWPLSRRQDKKKESANLDLYTHAGRSNSFKMRVSSHHCGHMSFLSPWFSPNDWYRKLTNKSMPHTFNTNLLLCKGDNLKEE